VKKVYKRYNSRNNAVIVPILLIIRCSGIDEKIMKFYGRQVLWQEFSSARPGGCPCANFFQANLEKQIKIFIGYFTESCKNEN